MALSSVTKRGVHSFVAESVFNALAKSSRSCCQWWLCDTRRTAKTAASGRQHRQPRWRLGLPNHNGTRECSPLLGHSYQRPQWFIPLSISSEEASGVTTKIMIRSLLLLPRSTTSSTPILFPGGNTHLKINTTFMDQIICGNLLKAPKLSLVV